MDMWSDPNLVPYMAVTAHWIHAMEVLTPAGKRYKLQLRTNLIGFHQVPGKHTGEHLAHTFIYITERLNITKKVSIYLWMYLLALLISYTDWLDHYG